MHSTDNPSEIPTLNSELGTLQAEIVKQACGDGPYLPEDTVIRRMVDEITRRAADGDTAARALLRAWLWNRAAAVLGDSNIENYRPAWYPNDAAGFWEWTCGDEFANLPECGNPRTDPEADIVSFY